MSDMRKQAAKEFAQYWAGKGYEKGESQPFWLSLLRDVYGVEHPEKYIEFEDQVHIDHTSFIDGMIPSTRVMIEQKGIDKRLDKPLPSGGQLLTPFQQAQRYIMNLPVDDHPRWVVTCNFKEFWVYDMNKPGGDPAKILLKDLPDEYYRLEFLVQTKSEHLKKEEDISVDAGRIVGKIYDALSREYENIESEHSLHSLNVLCVRLVFCLYAENSGIFGSYGMFRDYLAMFEAHKMRQALKDLFDVLDTPEEERDVYFMKDNPELNAFPYVNGGLFSDEHIEIPSFTDEIRELLLEEASAGFNWSDISPTIFGAVFESTLNPETRRSGGMHYTSVENIHKVIDALFLKDLLDEFEEVKSIASEKTRNRKLREFQTKLSTLTFLDPACGSGNFLTEAYLSLRRIENDVMRELMHGQMSFGVEGINPIQVSLSQFYGIEINDFAVTVAKTALWIAESQMIQETESIVLTQLDFLPLKSYTNIVEGNALRMDWEEVVPKTELNYIMGNPPFVGYAWQSPSQKDDMAFISGLSPLIGKNIDYVAAWYFKAAEFIQETGVKVAFVSTNSITQGEQVAGVWKPMYETFGVHIDFAHRTFQWDNEANIKAHVHCVIIGFSLTSNNEKKKLYDSEQIQLVENINPYLLDAPTVFIERRNKPICAVPEINIGNMPIDGGNYLFTKEEKEAFVKQEPASEQYFKLWYGSQEFINRKPRYCLWLGECTPGELRKMPECMKRIEAVRQFRLSSKRSSTVKLAEKPTRFETENMPKENYIVIPEVSSQRRRYVPMGYMDGSVLCSNKVRLMPEATLYHLGVLTSNVHMAWMRVVCGRLKSDYDYSIKIVYNNFPWPTPTDAQRARIEQTAQAILDARELYPDSSLADLYDENVMPAELRTAHQENDRAVMESYGFERGTEAYTSEAACVAELMKMYQKLTSTERS